MHHCRGVDAKWASISRVEQGNNPGIVGVRVGMNDTGKWCIRGKLWRKDDRRRFRRVQLLPEFWVGEEGNLACTSRRQGSDLRNDHRTVTLKRTAEAGDDFVEPQTLFHRHADYLPSDKALMILSVTSSFGLTQTTS